MSPMHRLFRAVKRGKTQYFASHPIRVFTATLKSGFLLHFFWTHYYSTGSGEGASMLPTSEIMGDWFLFSHHYRRGRDVQVGDVVQFKSVHKPGEYVIKRVVGLQGDFVLRDTPGSESDMMIQIPPGHCWLVGDNLPYSMDSRQLGPIPLALIRGKAISKILPFSERRRFENGLNLAIHK